MTISKYRSIVLFKIYEYLRIVSPYPHTIMIEPTNSCNLCCPACPTGSGKMNRPKRMMSYDEFKAIIDQCKGHVNDIILWNFGEPFLNKELIKMIKYAASHGMNTVTSTNGHFFRSEEFCLEIIESGLKRLIICLDGADQSTISIYRKNAKFDDIVKGFGLLTKIRKIKNSKVPIIELQFIIMKHNEHQRNYMKQFAIRLGADIYTEKTVGIGPDSSDSEFQDMAKKLLPNDLSLCRYYLSNDTFILKGNISNMCPFIYRTMVINSDGTVVPCCYDESSKYIMGNVFDDNLKTIWKNKKYQNFRNRVRTDIKSIPLCTKCSECRK